MKKNTMFRIGAVLLVAVLITTCAISGTFAKYLTTAKVQENARVAEFGVEITATNTDELFKAEYATDDNTFSGTYSVDSADGDHVVAPGTKGEAIGFSIAGAPEVAVRVDFELDITDICLKAGTYTDYTVRDYEGDKNGAYGEFTLAEDYHPIVFTLYHNGTAVKSGTAAQVAEYFEALSADYEANTNMATLGTYTLNWEWVYEQDKDAADTYLADPDNSSDAQLEDLGFGALGGAAIVSGGDATTALLVNLDVTVTQID